jgi:hypothetical protein
MLQRLRSLGADWKILCRAFGMGTSQSLRPVAEAALTKEYRVHLLAFQKDGKVRSTDISQLDPDAAGTAESEWGGLTGYSSRFGEAVRTAVNEKAP